jgi:hypothetical protein
MNEMGLEGQEGKEGPGRAFPAGPAATAGRDTVRRLSVAGPWPIWTKWTKPGFLPKFRGFSCSGGRWTEVDNLDKTLPRLASPGLGRALPSASPISHRVKPSAIEMTAAADCLSDSP